MRAPSSLTLSVGKFAPVGRFAGVLLADDLPALDVARRDAAVAFIQRRVLILPSFTLLGVAVIAIAVDVIGRVVGLARVARFIASRPLPLLSEYPRLIRSLGYAYIWETWPDTTWLGAST
jgi:hypothetical protein